MANELSSLLNLGDNPDSSTLQNIADLVTKLPENIQRFVTNPQAFTQLFGYNALPKQTGFAAGATGLSQQNPYPGGILNPKNEGYEEGYQEGEPIAIASMAAPGYGSALKFSAPKAYQALEKYMLKTGGMLPIMAGPESKTWNKEKAFTAGKMEAKGETPEKIFENTGMVRGLDNQWRQEISDKFAKMKQPGETFGEIHRKAGLNGVWAKEKTTVNDVLEHPDFFEAYPTLGKNIKVVTHSQNNPVKGSFNQNKGEISIREDLKPEEATSTLLHELQHAVQAKEQWNRGANAGALIRHYAKEKEGIMTQIEDLNRQGSEAIKADDMDKYRQLMSQRDVLSRKYIEFNPEEIGYDVYKHHAGEAEARLVQRRMNLSPEERNKIFPYEYTGEHGYGLDINPDEAIVTTKHPATINTPSQEYDYRGSHRAPYKTDDGTTAPAHELDRTYPEDVYGPHGHNYYGMNTQQDKDTLKILKAARGKPDQPIKVYRAVPKEHAGEDIYPGDWVTPNLEYAEEHGRRWDNGYHILEKTVPAKHIYTEGNSLHEFGYDPSE